MTKTCSYCEEAPATALKVEAEILCDADGEETGATVIRPICDACEAHWFDGTEAHPGTLPLAGA